MSTYKAYKIKLWGNGLKKWTVQFYLLAEKGSPKPAEVLGAKLAYTMKKNYNGHALVPGSITGHTMSMTGVRAQAAVKRTIASAVSLHYEQHMIHLVLDKLANLTEEDIEFLEDKHCHLGKDMHDWFNFLEWIKLTSYQQ